MATAQTLGKMVGEDTHLVDANVLPSGTSPADRRTLLKNGYLPIPICGKGPRWPWRSEPVTADCIARITLRLRRSETSSVAICRGELHPDESLTALRPTRGKVIN